MDVETWRKSEKVIKKSQKHYAHFDYRTSLADQWEYISVPENIATHGFYPLIHYTQKSDKFNPVSKKKKEKSREIRYAAHIDSCIYQYYSFLLNEQYNQRVGQDGISDVPVAYRTDLGKNNVHFSKAAIDFIRQCNECYVMIGDFTNFFDNLDHQYLKMRWCDLLGCKYLPPDHYAVFKNITKYSTWEREDLLAINQLKNTPAGIRKLNAKNKVLTDAQFHENKSHIQPKSKDEPYGIPQGSPISATLANVYMLDADNQIAALVRKHNGFYMRYSDDFMIVVPICDGYDAKEILGAAREIIASIPNVTLQPEKTQYFYYNEPHLHNCSKEVDKSADDKNKVINFLEFSFDGAAVTVRPKTITKYHYRMRRKGKTIAKLKGVSPKGKHISNRNIYEKYSERGAYGKRGNFLTYINRADAIFVDEPNITRDTRRHMQKIRKVITPTKKERPSG